MSRCLVAYFSVSGVTAGVAEKLAAETGAGLFEIRPVVPYTEKDVRWTNPTARCNKEKFGRKEVPIADTIEDFDSFDVIFIGFPVWYYSCPNIIATFLKSYDFTGKKLAFFATSGGSDIAPEKLRPLISGDATFAAAKRFAQDVSADKLRQWAQGII
ncbi:MAG: flavodoxin [Clostridia bacterium]|nr:flavodoxin [Clostridia bacterium]